MARTNSPLRHFNRTDCKLYMGLRPYRGTLFCQPDSLLTYFLKLISKYIQALDNGDEGTVMCYPPIYINPRHVTVGRCILTLSNPVLKVPGTKRLKLK